MKRMIAALCFALLSLNAHAAEPATVRVVGPDEKPVPGATVVYELPQKSYDTERHFITAETDATGRAKIDVQTRMLGITPLRGSVSAMAPGLAFGVTQLSRTLQLPDETIVRLANTRAISGEVRDAAGKAVAGAPVAVTYLQQPRSYSLSLRGANGNNHPFAARFTTATDAEGRFTIPGLPDSGKASLLLNDKRFVLTQFETDLAQPVAVNFTARRGATLEGRVLQDGAPVAGLAVQARPVDLDALGGEATTGADGRFALQSLETGAHTITVKVPREREHVVVPLEGVLAVEGETRTIAPIELKPGAIINGTVRDATTKVPIPDVEIRASIAYQGRIAMNDATAVTDAVGRYQLRIAPGDASIAAEEPARFLPSEKQGRRVRKGETSTVDFDLKPGVTIQGIARDENGAPVANAPLFAIQKISEENGSEPIRRFARTAADGRFRIEGLPAGEVILRGNTQWNVVSTVLRAPAQDATVTLQRRAQLPINGRVVGDDGTIVEGARITVSYYDGVETVMREAKTAADGRFLISGVFAGSQVEIRVEKDGWRVQRPPYVSSGGKITAPDGRTFPNPNPPFVVTDAVLQKMGRALSGLVVDAAGAPVAGARVVAGESSALADAAGNFTLRDLPGHDFTALAATANAFGSTQVRSKSTVLRIALATQKYQPQNVARGTQILRDLALDTTDENFNARRALPGDLARFDIDGAIELRHAMKYPDGSAIWQIISAIADRARATTDEKTRAAAQARIATLLEQLAPSGDMVTVEIAQKIADFAPDWARTVWLQARRTSKPVDAKKSWPEIAERFNLALLGIVLGEDKEIAADAAAMLDELTATVTTLEAAKKQFSWFGVIAEGAARCADTPRGLAALDKILNATPADSRIETWRSVVPILARRNRATALLRLEELVAFPPAKQQVQNNWTATSAFQWVAPVLVRELSQRGSQGEAPDGAAALALARRLQPEHKALALAYAARVLPEQATTLWREAFDAAPEQSWPGGERGIIVSLALQHAPKLGEELADKMDTALPQNEALFANLARERTSLALALAPYQPGRARQMLEQRWALRFAAGSFLQPPDELALARAMALVDVERALEWAQSVGAPNAQGEENPYARHNATRLDAMRAIAFTVMSDETMRRNRVTLEQLEREN